MTRPGPVNLLQKYAVARFSQRKPVVLAVTCFSGFSIPWSIRLGHMGKQVLLTLMMILVLICPCAPAFSAGVSGPLTLDGTTSRYSLEGHLKVYEDKTGAAGIDSVQSAEFSPTEKAVPNFGFTGSAYWIKLAVENPTSEAQTLFLQITNHYLDFIDIFIKSDRSSTVERYRGGARVPLSERMARGRHQVLQLVFAPGEAKTIFLRAQSETALRVSLVLSTDEGFRHDELKHYMLLGIFYGVLGFLIIYNIFGWSILRQRAYFYYILLLIGLGACQLSFDGLVPQVTIFSQPERLLHLFNSGIGLTFVFNILFVTSFMDARTKYPILYRVLDVFLVLAVVNTILFVVSFYVGNLMALIYGPVLAWPLAIVTGLMWYRGESHARYLFLAHVQFPILAAMHVGMMVGIVTVDFLWGQSLKFGYLWQGMFLSLAMADRYSIMQRNFQHVLEDKVTERSAELVEANENLQREIVERKRGEDATERSKREWEETFDTVPDLIAIIDRNHVIQRLNKAMADKLKLHPRDAIGRSCYEFCHGTDGPFPGCPLLRSLDDGAEHSAEVVEPRLGGIFLVSVTPMGANGGQADRFVHVARDITERKSFEDKLRKLATTDSLTNIWNRRHFRYLAKRELDRTKRYGGELALMMIDLDHFKRINDTYGHAVGDEALKTVAAIGRATLRRIDMFARYGGEEFVIALPETSLEQALQVAERLRLTLNETPITTETEAKPLYMTVSIGLTVTGPGSADLNTLLKQADEALYRAKDNGRNRVEVFRQPA
jgi:diguanylate cyclase (GGDEF)-like protein/PAS domain S-box-containing protein